MGVKWCLIISLDVIDLNNFIWISSFSELSIYYLLCIFLSCPFFLVPICKCSFYIIDANLWSVTCVTVYPESIIFLLISFGSQISIYMVKYIYFYFWASSGFQSQFEKYLSTLGL